MVTSFLRYLQRTPPVKMGVSKDRVAEGELKLLVELERRGLLARERNGSIQRERERGSTFSSLATSTRGLTSKGVGLLFIKSFADPMVMRKHPHTKVGIAFALTRA